MFHDENLFSLVDAVQKATGRRPHISSAITECEGKTLPSNRGFSSTSVDRFVRQDSGFTVAG